MIGLSSSPRCNRRPCLWDERRLPVRWPRHWSDAPIHHWIGRDWASDLAGKRARSVARLWRRSRRSLRSHGQDIQNLDSTMCWNEGDVGLVERLELPIVEAGTFAGHGEPGLEGLGVAAWTCTKPSSLAGAPASTKSSQCSGTRPLAGNREPAQHGRPGRPTPQPARATPAGRYARHGNA